MCRQTELNVICGVNVQDECDGRTSATSSQDRLLCTISDRCFIFSLTEVRKYPESVLLRCLFRVKVPD